MQQEGIWSPEGQYYGPHTFSDGDGVQCRIDGCPVGPSLYWRQRYLHGSLVALWDALPFERWVDTIINFIETRRDER